MTTADDAYGRGLRYVGGDGVDRDWREARRFFGLAGAADHEGGALAHASLVALGAAAPPDWAGAVRLLERAAARHPRAAASLDLIRRMTLTVDGGPVQLPRVKPIATSPRLALAEALFTPAECAHLRTMATPLLQPSVIVDPRSGAQRPHPVRTSDSAVLGPIQQDAAVHALNRRLAAATGTAVEQGEPLVVLRYAPGQQYRMHHDCLPGEANQRVLTAIVYLNDDFEDGATAFEALGQSFRPAIGDALIFLNVDADGRPDKRSRHAGLPVVRGEKWIATRWIRRVRFDPWNLYG